MKTIMFTFTLVALLAAGLFAGCSQPAAGPAGQTQPAAPALSQPVSADPAAGAVVPADNNSAASIAPPAIEAVKATRIGDILQDPKGFGGKTVVVEGRIASECPSGCWFTLKDGNAVIYIDLKPSNLVIPQRKGSIAKVTAEVVTEGSDVYLIGTKVDF